MDEECNLSHCLCSAVRPRRTFRKRCVTLSGAAHLRADKRVCCCLRERGPNAH